MWRVSVFLVGRRITVCLGIVACLAVLPLAAQAGAPASQRAMTPQDAALIQAIKGRLAAWGDPHVDSRPRATLPGQPGALPFDDGSKADPTRAASPQPGAQASAGAGCALCGVAIEARNGHVRLSGRVRTPEQRAAAEDLARRVPHVQSVANAIAVGP